MNDCHSQAVRSSRASSKSEKRRNSPASGERTSPSLGPLPGKSTPFRRVWTIEYISTSGQHTLLAATHLDEELRVERAGGRVKRRARDRGIDMVLGGDGVRDEQVHDLVRAEARIAHARKDRVRKVRRLGDEQVGGRLRDIGPTGEERDARAAGTV